MLLARVELAHPAVIVIIQLAYLNLLQITNRCAAAINVLLAPILMHRAVLPANQAVLALMPQAVPVIPARA